MVGAGQDISKEILRFGRNSPLHVGGVGKGSQTCINDCMFPLALERSDGTMHEGTFTSPIVEQSHTPALLGLRSLMRHNAILDLGKKMMHLIPDDREAEYELPEGTESYPLKQAPSGHLLLPFTDFKKWEKRRFEKMNVKMIHLFTDDEPRTVSPQPADQDCNATRMSPWRMSQQHHQPVQPRWKSIRHLPPKRQSPPQSLQLRPLAQRKRAAITPLSPNHRLQHVTMCLSSYRHPANFMEHLKPQGLLLESSTVQ